MKSAEDTSFSQQDGKDTCVVVMRHRVTFPKFPLSHYLLISLPKNPDLRVSQLKNRSVIEGWVTAVKAVIRAIHRENPAEQEKITMRRFT